jgi:hypothetical protein
MLYNENFGRGENNSNASATYNGTVSVPVELYNDEMSAKNEAYSFIISSVLVEQFLYFCGTSQKVHQHLDFLIENEKKS